MSAPVSPVRRLVRWGIALIVVLALAAGGFAWWASRWAPPAADWPMQGIAVGAANQPLRWASLKRHGVGFAYVDAMRAGRFDPAFAAMQDGARAAGLRAGPVLHFSLCAGASDQVTGFVRNVPRDPEALPPVVLVEREDGCTSEPSRALLLSELTTYLTQIETHLGKSAIVGADAAMESTYGLSGAINRPLWLTSLRTPPATPGWTLWLANDARRIDGAAGPVRWLVLDNSGRRVR